MSRRFPVTEAREEKGNPFGKSRSSEEEEEEDDFVEPLFSEWLVDKLSETRIVKFGSKMASTTQRLVRWSWAQAASLTWYTASTAILMVGPAVFLAVTEPALGENNRLFGDPHNPGSASAIGAAAAAEQIASDNASLRAAGLSQAYHSAPVSIPPPV